MYRGQRGLTIGHAGESRMIDVRLPDDVVTRVAGRYSSHRDHEDFFARMDTLGTVCIGIIMLFV